LAPLHGSYYRTASKRTLANVGIWPTVYVRRLAREQSVGGHAVSLCDRLQSDHRKVTVGQKRAFEGSLQCDQW